jgi:adenylate cyclase, class 2
MIPLAQVRKSRMVYRHPSRGDVSVVIDDIVGLGAYAETEVIHPDPRGADEILEAIELALGPDQYPIVSRLYRDLVFDQAQVAVGAGRDE